MSSNWLEGFQDRVAVVTGGASGIGLAITRSLVELGVKVVIGDITPPSGLSTEEESRTRFVTCDVTRESDLEELMATAAGLGGLHFLVNSAGISRKYRIKTITAEEWMEVINVNLTGTALAIKHALSVMTEGAAVVNVGSMAGFSTLSMGTHVYAASKGGVHALTRSLVYELSPAGIRVNTIVPGVVDTKIFDAHDDEWKRNRLSRIPAGVPATPEDVADAVMFLLSSRARYITGQTLVVDGGLSAVVFSPEEAMKPAVGSA